MDMVGYTDGDGGIPKSTWWTTEVDMVDYTWTWSTTQMDTVDYRDGYGGLHRWTW